MTHIERVDLNLLAPLTALLEERHVSRAAARVSLSQPAMSRALQRLRAAFGDELLVRGAEGYQLTPRAERLRLQLRSVLPQLEAMFTHSAFDPATAAEVLRITGTDYATAVLGPALFQRLFQQSPDSRLTFRAWHDDALGDLERGLTDLVLTAVPAPPALRTQQLLEERYVCLLSAGHPLAGRARLSLDEYLSCSHIEVTVTEGRQGLLDQRLGSLAAPRHISLSVPHHAVAPLAIPGTGLVATLPRRLVAQHATDPGLRCVPAPREIEPMTYRMIWHPRLDDDPAQNWLRTTIRAVTAELPTLPDPEPAVPRP
ncbi:LysR family transcriptional regulator [Streptomyces sp. NPDC020362]|uniref:LysR family transcriptional regulator n=1 Tax=unclassified Streptomyces TaxID=2593676 RepID=UPI00340B5E16